MGEDPTDRGDTKPAGSGSDRGDADLGRQVSRHQTTVRKGHRLPIGKPPIPHVGDGGRPSEILPLAITTDSEPKLLLPTRRTEDFDECCDLLGLRDEEQRDRFRTFLLPRSEQRGGRRHQRTGNGHAVRRAKV